MTWRRPTLVLLPSRRPEPRVQRPVLAAGCLLLVALCAWMAVVPQALVDVDALAYDRLLRGLRPATVASDVVVVDVDEASLRTEGQWPWPRFRVAQLLDAIHAAGARAIGIDFLFAEADRLSLAQIRDRYRDTLHLEIGLDRVPVEFHDNDAVLAASLARTGAILGVWFGSGEARAEPPAPPARLPSVILVRERRAPEVLPLPVGSTMLPPFGALAGADRPVGFVNVMLDADGVVRRVALLVRYQDRIYPSLALAAVMRAIGATNVVVRVTEAGVESLGIGTLRVPTDRQGSVLLPFGEGTARRFDRLSAAALLAGRIPAERMRGKVVLVGSSAAAAGDVQPTPFDHRLPGVLVHAVTADCLLRGDVLLRPSWSLGAQFVLVLLSFGATLFLVTLCSTAIFGLGSVALAAGWWYGSRLLLGHQDLYVSPVPPMLALAAGFVVLGLVRYWAEERAAVRKAIELSDAQDSALTGLAAMTETRDPETGRHIVRTRHYVQALALRLSSHPKFRAGLSPAERDAMAKSAPLHDIGKVGVPDAILLKPGSLTDAELVVMRRHTTLGQQVLVRAGGGSTGGEADHSFLHFGRQMAGAHHERWDGSGYPLGLRGEAIPVSARLMALADTYDAMRSRRPYKEPMSHEEAVSRISVASGMHFDPDVVAAFLEIADEFAAIAARYADDDATGARSVGTTVDHHVIP